MGVVKKEKNPLKEQIGLFSKYGQFFLENSEIKTFNKITKEIIIDSFKYENFTKEFSKLENILGINSFRGEEEFYHKIYK